MNPNSNTHNNTSDFSECLDRIRSIIRSSGKKHIKGIPGSIEIIFMLIQKGYVELADPKLNKMKLVLKKTDQFASMCKSIEKEFDIVIKDTTKQFEEECLGEE